MNISSGSGTTIYATSHKTMRKTLEQAVIDQKKYSKQRNIMLKDCHISGHNLSRADLPGIVINDGYVCNCNFDGANLRGATLFNCNLANCTFRGADLTDADFRWSNLDGVDISDAITTAARGLPIRRRKNENGND